jgi:hypothetical protein
MDRNQKWVYKWQNKGNGSALLNKSTINSNITKTNRNSEQTMPGENVRGYRSCLKKNRTKVQKANMMRRSESISQVLWAWSYQLLRLLLQHTVLILLLPAAAVLTLNMSSMAAWVKKDLQLYLLMIQDHKWWTISMGLLPILDKLVIGCTCWWFH